MKLKLFSTFQNIEISSNLFLCMEYRFVGRQRELEYLEDLYRRPGLNTCAVFGRRQAGKSTLLMEFAKDKRTVYLQFSRGSYYENLTRMRFDIGGFLGTEPPETDSFSEILLILRDICRQEKTLVVFDELPYLMDGAPFVPSIIQRFIDLDVKGLDCMVVICGSSVGMMRDTVENVRNPLYGRFMDRLEVGELGYIECMEFHPNMSNYDVLRTYMTIGGVPRYHLEMDCDTYEESLKKCFFGPNSPLRDEGENIVSDEAHPEVYSGIASCISDGIVLQSRICEKLDIDKSECSRRIKEMLSLGLVERRHPMVGAPRRPSYIIRNNMLAFFHDVIRHHRTLLSNPNISPEIKMRALSARIDTFMGRRFELLCRDYLIASYTVGDIGTWWGNVDGTDTDIDIVAQVFDERMHVSYLMVECKFSRSRVRHEVLDALEEKTGQTTTIPNLRYMIMAVSGFDHELEDEGSEGNVILVGADRILGRVPPDDLESFPMRGQEILG